MSAETRWWVSTDEIGKPGVSPKTAGPFSSREDALSARQGMEKLYGNYSVFEERVKPAVELPTVPTNGVLSWTAGPNTQNPGMVERRFGEWYLSPCISTWARSTTPTQVHATGLGLQVPIASVISFVEATAVPTEALMVLRGRHQITGCGKWVDDFLAAIDEANA